MARHIPLRNQAGSIIGMQPDDGSSQIASLVEETMKAVGAANPTTPPPKPNQGQRPTQSKGQSIPQLNSRTIAALIVSGLLVIVILFSLVNQVPLRPPPLPTAVVIIPTSSATSIATLTPIPTVTELPPSPEPTTPPVQQSEPVIVEQPPPVPAQPTWSVPVELPTDTSVPTIDIQATDESLRASQTTIIPSPGQIDPTFVASFLPQPECNIFIGYVGPKRAHCNAVYATQTAQAAKP